MTLFFFCPQPIPPFVFIFVMMGCLRKLEGVAVVEGSVVGRLYTEVRGGIVF
jgi:hypothetical protein